MLRDVASRRVDLHPVPAPGRASLARLASPSLFLSPSFLRALSLSLSVPAELRSLSRSEPLRSAQDESLQWHEFNSTLFILQPRTMWIHPLTSTPDSTLLGGALEAAGEVAQEEEEEAREGRRRTRRSSPGSAPGRADASRTPRSRKAAVVRVGESGPRTMGAPRPLGFFPISFTPLGHSALGLFHWRTLPKMVICVRGRECGFPRFRVTWRERDSLACS